MQKVSHPVSCGLEKWILLQLLAKNWYDRTENLETRVRTIPVWPALLLFLFSVFLNNAHKATAHHYSKTYVNVSTPFNQKSFWFASTNNKDYCLKIEHSSGKCLCLSDFQFKNVILPNNLFNHQTCNVC